VSARRWWAPLAGVLGLALGATPAGAASSWAVSAGVAGSGYAAAAQPPAAPAPVSAKCGPASRTVTVSWPAVPRATSYTVYQSSGTAYVQVATTAATSWTSGALANGKYTYKLSASVGANWAGPQSTASPTRTIDGARCE
jgi:hypothetical protein